MKKIMLLFFLLISVISFSEAQSIPDDGKITKRERRFLYRKIYGSDRAVRLREWKDAKKTKRLQAKVDRKHRKMFRKIHANKRNWGSKENRRAHARNYKKMNKDKSWLAREHPKKHLKESMYP